MTNTPAPAEKVPAEMRERFDAIVALTDDFCQRHLNADYAQLARHTAAALSRKRPSPGTGPTPGPAVSSTPSAR